MAKALQRGAAHIGCASCF
ncbi:MAG TPA: hypothetical protein EYG02_00450 [Henriciella marina]|uniref:Uncharacterized protein n=1 Tax=Henriciella algicola TaxID=1608422 RepID=A0A399RPW9_9PROT|nr:hypothetical protein D1222_05200 [Henriciella algicola]HIG22479.1 hypothetical protein [Henriciella sp.]HIK63481.1 hypothetical protein [Henriciella marina]